jgi:predicted SpoU family rRNA methylase
MKVVAALLLLVAMAAPVLVAQQPPEWATREYGAPVDKVFAAALQSIQQQKHEMKTVDHERKQVTFHVGLTAWSWGYNMMLSVNAIDATHAKVIVAVVSKSGGDALSWGSGKKEVRKILGGIDAEIAAGKTSLKD